MHSANSVMVSIHLFVVRNAARIVPAVRNAVEVIVFLRIRIKEMVVQIALYESNIVQQDLKIKD